MKNVVWKEGLIKGVEIIPFSVFSDDRGWLAELFRSDSVSPELFPEMGYLSVTLPGKARGPHEHQWQTDRFAFFHGTYTLYLWDPRRSSSSFGLTQKLEVGVGHQVTVAVPPGVVHAYMNSGSEPAYVLNFPNVLYAGENRKGPVDEIRHEDRTDSPYTLN